MNMTKTAYPLSPDRLETKFSDKYPPYDLGEALAESNRCLYCFDAPCVHACPTSIDIPTFIKKIASGNVRGSAKTILSANLLGESCARVCPVEVLCEGDCVYTTWGRTPISIGRLQRYATENGARYVELERKHATGKSIGLVGAGPASLACAGRLALLGHEAVIYEKGTLPGGLNTTGVAPYKMPADQVLHEVEFIGSLGVKIETGVEVGKDISADQLLEKHDAVFLGPGLGKDSSMDALARDTAGVLGAVEWIRRMKTDPKMSLDSVRHAAVIGGGNTALDAARELAQLGVEHVRLVYRRSEAEMRGYGHEWTQAKKEGVVLVPNAIVKEVVSQNGTVNSLALVRARNGKPTDHELDEIRTDLVIVAIGQARLLELVNMFPGVECDGRGHIVADEETGVTGNPLIFAAGDACNGGKEVVNAVAEGQRAATAIDDMLMGSDSGGKNA